MLPNFTVRSHQVPIGQGGLMYSSMWHRGMPRRSARESCCFSFVYDFGSMRGAHLAEGLRSLQDLLGSNPPRADGKPDGYIDLVVISHLDKDHANGLELLAQTAGITIGTLVLPCLDPIATTMAAISASVGDDGDALRRLISNPRDWLGRHGVERLVMVRSDGSDLHPEDQAGYNGSVESYTPGTELGGYSIRLSELDNEDGRTDDEPALPQVVLSAVAGRLIDIPPNETSPGNAIEIHEVSSAPRVTIHVDAFSTAVWQLQLYHHPYPAKLLSRFYREVRKAFPKLLGTEPELSCHFGVTSRLLSVLSNSKRRRKLRACYDVAGIEQNAASISLYSGPVADAPLAYLASIPSAKRSSWRLANGYGPAGWLSTGDAKLMGRTTWPRWKRHFAPYFKSVVIFVLPHHGAWTSIRKEAIQCLRDTYMIACAKSDSASHPDPRVVKLVTNRMARRGAAKSPDAGRKRDAPFHIVTENPASVVHLTSFIF